MKVIHVCPLYFPYVGGIEYHVKLLSENLVKLNADVEIVTTDPEMRCKKEEIINGVKIRRLRSFAPEKSYYLAPSLIGVLRNARADVVHAHNIQSFPMLFAALAKSANRIPLVSTFYFHGHGHTFLRDLLFQPYRRILGEYVSKKTDLLICISEYERKMIEARFRTHPKTTVVRAGLRFRPPATIDRHTGKKVKIAFVGRLEEYKGVQYLLRAFSRLLSEQVDAQLWIIGEGCYESKLKMIAEQLKIMDRVVFSRKKGDEIIAEYCESDIIVIPSRYESFNLVAIEALACGAKVITTPVGEGYALVRDGKCFGLSDPADVDELYGKIRQALSSNHESNDLRQGIIRTYSYETIARLAMDEYRNL